MLIKYDVFNYFILTIPTYLNNTTDILGLQRILCSGFLALPEEQTPEYESPIYPYIYI
jgi:hypothetical protein